MLRIALGSIVCVFLLSGAAAEEVADVRVRDAELRLRFDAAFDAEQRTMIVDWVGRRGEIVAAYYGRFPVPRVVINVQAVDGRGVRGGTTFPGSRPSIRLRVGREATLDRLNRDWVLVHEMIHLALPNVADEHLWLAEGLATYVEGVARVQAGDMSPETMWGDLVKGMPQGLPREGDQGLDNTHTWGRTYWGGAIFCLLADVEIRKRSDNRLGLQDALQAILKESGGFTVEWPVTRIFAVGDEAIAQHTLAELYTRMKDSGASMELASLWQQLGVIASGSSASFDDRAPLASTRAAIVAAE